MPDKKTIEKAKQDKRAGKAPTTQAGEFVREEIHKIRRGETRSAVTGAGDCDRTFRGAARRRRPSAAAQRQGQGAHPQERRICL